jgi:hypothetical protein
MLKSNLWDRIRRRWRGDRVWGRYMAQGPTYFANGARSQRVQWQAYVRTWTPRQLP